MFEVEYTLERKITPLTSLNLKLALVGVSKTDLAKKLKVTKTTVSSWVKGKNIPKKSTLTELTNLSNGIITGDDFRRFEDKELTIQLKIFRKNDSGGSIMNPDAINNT